MNDTALESSATITRVLSQSWRRLTVVRFCETAATLLPLAVLAGELTVLFGARLLPSPAARWWTAVAFVLVALAAAAARASLKRPTVLEAASIVDSRLGCGAALTTAAQFLGQDDPFAALVTRHAATRLHGFHAAKALPIEPPHVARVLLLSAIAAPALAVVVLSVEQGGLDRGVASVAARAGLAIPAAIADGAAAKTPTGKPPIENTIRTAEIRRPGGDLPLRPSEASAIPQPTEHERSGFGAQRGSHETAGDGTNASTNEHPLGDVTAHAGGVGRGTLSPDSVPASAARARGESTATYREAWSRAQSAVAVDRVPADRRVLVRKYFSAIGPSESQ